MTGADSWGPRHGDDLRMARRSRAAAVATDAAILTRGRDFTGSKDTTGIESDVGKKPGFSYSAS